MKFSDLDDDIALQFLIHFRAFNLASDMIIGILNEHDLNRKNFTVSDIHAILINNAVELLRARSDDEIRQELKDLDRILDIAKNLQQHGLFPGQEVNFAVNKFWGKIDESN